MQIWKMLRGKSKEVYGRKKIRLHPGIGGKPGKRKFIKLWDFKTR